MKTASSTDTLAAAERAARHDGRAALCQIVRTEGSTPGKRGWKMVVPVSGECVGNLGGGAFEALVKADARAKLAESRPAAEVKRYYLTEEAARGEPTGMVCGGMVEVFLEVLMDKPLLVICGGGPVGQALAQNAVLCDFDVAVADDREEYRRPELFPEGVGLLEVDREYSTDLLAGHGEREVCAVVVTRCWETDLAALGSILRRPAPGLSYLGLMGSRRKVERIRGELAAQRLGSAGVELHAPIGLPIGAESPGEIAVSVLAEVIAARSGAGAAAERLVTAKAAAG